MDSIVKPALVLMSGRAVAMLATFLLPVLLVRVFDPAGFGTYKQLFLVYTTIYVIGSVLAESLFYFLPRTPGQAGRYVANAVLALGAIGVSALALLWAYAAAVARGLGNPALQRDLPLVGAFLMLMLPAVSLEIAMTARKRYRYASWSYAASDLLRVLALVAPALVWRRLDALLAGALAFGAARLLAALLYFRAEFREGLRPDASLYRGQLAYVLPFALAVIVETLQVNYHHYAVSHRFDAATFAIYAVGCFQIPLFELVASPMANVMMVRMAEKLRDGRAAEAREIWAGTARALALAFFPVVALLLVAAPDLIVFLFTESYQRSVPIFMIWSLSIALSVLPSDGVLRVYAATRFLLALSVMKLVLIAASIGAFISLFGLRGAVWVTIAVAAAAKAAALLGMARLMGVRLARLLPWRELLGIAGLAAVAALPALLLRSALLGPAFVRLALTGLVYGVSYLLLLFHSRLLAEAEKRALRDRLPGFSLTVAAGESRS